MSLESKLMKKKERSPIEVEWENGQSFSKVADITATAVLPDFSPIWRSENEQPNIGLNQRLLPFFFG
jgi:hypothetical protein